MPSNQIPATLEPFHISNGRNDSRCCDGADAPLPGSALKMRERGNGLNKRRARLLFCGNRHFAPVPDFPCVDRHKLFAEIHDDIVSQLRELWNEIIDYTPGKSKSVTNASGKYDPEFRPQTPKRVCGLGSLPNNQITGAMQRKRDLLIRVFLPRQTSSWGGSQLYRLPWRLQHLIFRF